MGLSMGGVFLFVRWAANFIAGRVDKGTQLVIDGLKHQIEILLQSEKDLRAELAEGRDEFRGYRRETDERLAECMRKHAEAEADALRFRAMMQGWGDAKNVAQLMLAAEKFREDDGQDD